MRAPAEHLERVLAALQPDRCIVVADLAEAAGLDGRSLLIALTALVKAGLAARAEQGCFTLTAEGAAQRAAGTWRPPEPPPALRAPRADTYRDRLWQALRMRRSGVTPAELVALARTKEQECSAYASTTQYLRVLKAARYVRELRRAPSTGRGSNGDKRYTLLKDTGPLAPQLYERGRALYDPNTRETFRLRAAPSQAAQAAGGAA